MRSAPKLTGIASAGSPPLVSVLIPVFNRERFIGPAVESALAQSLRDVEIVIVDDGSNDDTARCVRSFGDPRIRLVQHPRNLGIPAARNSALDEARGRYVAWLDSDDVARGRRIERQVRYLERHPEVAMVGACAGKIDSSGKQLSGVRVPPLTHDEIRCRLLFTSAFQQSSIMGRRHILDSYRYGPEFDVCEDIDTAVRIARRHKVANMPEVLVDRRMHPEQIGREARERVLTAQARISAPQLDRLGLSYTPADLHRHCLLGRVPRSAPTDEELRWADEWVLRLIDANDRAGVLSPSALRFVAGTLLVERYRRRSSWHAVRMFVGSRFAGDLLSSRALRWTAAAMAPIVAQSLSAALAACAGQPA